VTFSGMYDLSAVEYLACTDDIMKPHKYVSVLPSNSFMGTLKFRLNESNSSSRMKGKVKLSL
jgi:hypothetical protein